MEKHIIRQTILGLAGAAALALSGCETPGSMHGDRAGAGGKCHGINGCKGQGACGGKKHGCAGHNGCKGKGWLKMDKKECESKGGRFEAM